MLYPEYSGTLKKLYVKEGQQVKKGKLLAQIDDAGLKNQLEQLEIQTQLSKLTTTDSQKNRTTPQSNAHYETILPKMKHLSIILVQLFLV